MGNKSATGQEELPPSYEEAVLQSNTGVYERPATNPTPPPRPQRPSSSAPSAHSQNGPPPTNKPSNTGSLYTNNDALPFRYPQGYFCDKCKNTGYKIKNNKICRNCWDKFYLNKNAYNPNKSLPFKYPARFLCEKCNNTGYKIKNGKTCKDCWGRFCKRTYSPSVTSFLGFTSATDTIMIPLASQPAGPPLRVPPGDPRLGGMLCGRCRGSGIVHFLLDEELCPVCGGIGRVLPQSGPPGPQSGFFPASPFAMNAPMRPANMPYNYSYPQPGKY